MRSKSAVDSGTVVTVIPTAVSPRVGFNLDPYHQSVEEGVEIQPGFRAPNSGRQGA